jgi:hypothetical protein
MVFDTSRFFEFTSGETYRIQFDSALTRVDKEYVYGKVKRKEDGTLDRGPKGVQILVK